MKTTSNKKEKFYKIITGIDIPSCRLNSDEDKIIGAGCIYYYKTYKQYEASEEKYIELFNFTFNLKNEEIKIFNTEFSDDIDLEDLTQNIKMHLIDNIKE